MEKDFHYYCLGVLPRASGLTAEDASTVAHPSAPFRLGKPLLDAEYSPEGKGMPFSARSEWSSPSMSQKWNSVLERI